jgi:capsule polysaccharide modification protein KpsS
VENKEKYFLVSDLEIYKDLLRKKNVDLEKSVLFLLSDYKEKYASGVNMIIENHSFANSNYLLANNILNS